VPGWVEHAVFWQIYPLGFTGAEADARDQVGVVHRLATSNHGWTMLLSLAHPGFCLGRFSPRPRNGYDTIDYFQIDPRLGDDADFDALIEAAHGRGLRVVLDGVFNHVGREFPLFRRAVAAGPDAPDPAWFRLSWPADRAPGQEPEYETFEGHRQLVALNHDETCRRAPRCPCHEPLARNGAPTAGGSTPLMRFHGDFGRRCCRGFEPNILTRMFLARSSTATYAGFVRDTGVDAVTQYELWKAIWSALNDRNFFETGLGRWTGTNSWLDSFVPLTFVGNHDVNADRKRADRRQASSPRLGCSDDVRRHAFDLWPVTSRHSAASRSIVPEATMRYVRRFRQRLRISRRSAGRPTGCTRT